MNKQKFLVRVAQIDDIPRDNLKQLPNIGVSIFLDCRNDYSASEGIESSTLSDVA